MAWRWYNESQGNKFRERLKAGLNRRHIAARTPRGGNGGALANDSAFGLSAGICTTSLKHASHFKASSEAGMVMVNLPTAGVDYHVPFGGTKGSSYGAREQGRYAAEFYTRVKTAYTLA